MSEKTIVLVTDRGDSKHGEISILDDPGKAERLVETLLEAGFEENRIKVFAGRSSEFQVSSRPVVALVAEGEEAESPMTATVESQEAPPDDVPAEVPVEDPAEVPAEAPDPESVAEEDKAKTEEEAEPATADVAAPVRFSSLFRSA